MLLDLLGEGLTNKQIAARMFLAEKTVKNYVSRLLAKLGMERRTQAAVFISKLDRRKRRSALRGEPAPSLNPSVNRPGARPHRTGRDAVSRAADRR